MALGDAGPRPVAHTFVDTPPLADATAAATAAADEDDDEDEATVV